MKKSLLLALCGLCLIGGGLFYDVMFAGIPYQDPTAEMQAQWELQSHRADLIMRAVVVFAFGAGIASATVFWRQLKRHLK